MSHICAKVPCCDVRAVFYFSKNNGWTRDRVAAGGRSQINERLAATLYYQCEVNARDRPARINTLALQMELRIRRTETHIP